MATDDFLKRADDLVRDHPELIQASGGGSIRSALGEDKSGWPHTRVDWVLRHVGYR
jgi:hypothetical protein